MKPEFVIRALVFFASIVIASCGGSDSEALQRGRNYFEERLLKCGDTWVGKRGDRFMQMKELGFILHRKEVTPADRANGIEWFGYVEIRGRIFRNYSNGRWQEWQNWPLMFEQTLFSDFSSTVEIMRTNWNWQVGPKDFVPGAPMGAIAAAAMGVADKSLGKVNFTCAQVPM